MCNLIFPSAVLFLVFASGPLDANALPNESRCFIRVSHGLLIDSDSLFTDSELSFKDSGTLLADTLFSIEDVTF